MIYFGYAASLLMGIVMGLIGGGGSILTVPILVYLFAFEPLSATLNSLFVVGGTALVGAILSARAGHVDFKRGIQFAGPSFLGVFVARQMILPWLPDPVLQISDFSLSKGALVMSTFAILMLSASLAMIRRPNSPAVAPGHGPWKVGQKGFLVGGVTGFVGAGGGFLIIPALVLLLGLPMRVAVGTSLAIIAANSLFGFTISFQPGITNWILLGSILGLGIVGLFIGRQFAAKFSDAHLKKIFGYFVLVMGTLILLDQLIR